MIATGMFYSIVELASGIDMLSRQRCSDLFLAKVWKFWVLGHYEGQPRGSSTLSLRIILQVTLDIAL
jgi:hypothetical protein